MSLKPVTGLQYIIKMDVLNKHAEIMTALIVNPTRVRSQLAEVKLSSDPQLQYTEMNM